MAGHYTNYLALSKITWTWRQHREISGSYGGVDFRAEVDTPIRAPSGGLVTYDRGTDTGGWSVTIKHNNPRWETWFLHLSRFAREGSWRCKQGQIVAYSGGAKGATGSGISKVPHIHWHLVDRHKRERGEKDNRANPLDHIGEDFGDLETELDVDVPGFFVSRSSCEGPFVPVRLQRK